jgi:hypothetical protein
MFALPTEMFGVELLPAAEALRGKSGLGLAEGRGALAGLVLPAAVMEGGQEPYSGEVLVGVVGWSLGYQDLKSNASPVAMNAVQPALGLGARVLTREDLALGVALLPTGDGRLWRVEGIPSGAMLGESAVETTLERRTLGGDLGLSLGWRPNSMWDLGAGYVFRYEKTENLVFGEHAVNPVIEQRKVGAAHLLTMGARRHYSSAAISVAARLPGEKAFEGYLADPTTGGTLTNPEYEAISARDVQPALIALGWQQRLESIGRVFVLTGEVWREFWSAGRLRQKDGLSTDAPATDFQDTSNFSIGLGQNTPSGWEWQVSTGWIGGNLGNGSRAGAASRVGGIVFGKPEAIARGVLAGSIRLMTREAPYWWRPEISVYHTRGTVAVDDRYEAPGRYDLQATILACGVEGRF